MENQFVTKYQSICLKDLGFEEPCLGYWRNENLPKPITICKYTTKEDMEYEVNNQDEHHNFKNIIALAPLFQQVFDWFREKHNLNGVVHYYNNLKKWGFSVYSLEMNGKEYIEFTKKEDRSIKFDSFHDARLECVNELIRRIK